MTTGSGVAGLEVVAAVVGQVQVGRQPHPVRHRDPDVLDELHAGRRAGSCGSSRSLDDHPTGSMVAHARRPALGGDALALRVLERHRTRDVLEDRDVGRVDRRPAYRSAPADRSTRAAFDRGGARRPRSSDMPRARNLLIVVGRSRIVPASENVWRSVEIVSGANPSARAARATANAKLPPPWPDVHAHAALPCAPQDGSTRPSSSTIVCARPWKRWVTMSPGRSRSKIVVQRQAGLGDVDHQPRPRPLGRLEGRRQRCVAVVARLVRGHPDLDPEADVADGPR